MAATKIGVVYSLAQKKRRDLLIPDDDKQLNDPAFVLPGTAMLTLDFKQAQTMTGEEIDAWLAQQIGPASSDRHALLDFTGAVVAINLCDPAVDKVPANCTWVQSDIAVVGGSFSSGVYVPPPVVVTPPNGQMITPH